MELRNCIYLLSPYLFLVVVFSLKMLIFGKNSLLFPPLFLKSVVICSNKDSSSFKIGSRVIGNIEFWPNYRANPSVGELITQLYLNRYGNYNSEDSSQILHDFSRIIHAFHASGNWISQKLKKPWINSFIFRPVPLFHFLLLVR